MQKAILPIILAMTAATAHRPYDLSPPATRSGFTIPLSDGTTGTAVILPIDATQSWLVYADSTGQLGSYLLTTPTTPEPPSPTPPPPPPTPVPTPQPPLPPEYQRKPIYRFHTECGPNGCRIVPD
jgi:hypothetical protein